MATRSNFQLLTTLCFMAIGIHAQEVQSPSLNIGDPAPPLRVREWIKGSPVPGFKKGSVYVVEFWATWCRPCIAGIPHLSALAAKYKGEVTVLGIDVYEKRTTSFEQIRAFVDSMGYRMEYQVAAEDSNFMVISWFDASGERGIPKSFVVDAEGKLAWIGQPKELNEVLPKIVNNTWDIKEALAKRNLERHLDSVDEEANYQLARYSGEAGKPDDLGKPDSALLAINEIVRKEPALKYKPAIASHTFSALLKTNPQKAYEYGEAVLKMPADEDPPYYIVFGVIDWYSDKLHLPTKIYQLGAEAYQTRMDADSETADFPKFYDKMAEMYWRVCDKKKAIEAEQKAIEALKREKDFLPTDLELFEFRLQQYKNL
jgi:thiol-disulfide isomerase/thioredoxin